MVVPQRSTLRPCLEVWLLRLGEEVQRNPTETGGSRASQRGAVVGWKQGPAPRSWYHGKHPPGLRAALTT